MRVSGSSGRKGGLVFEAARLVAAGSL